MSKRLACPPAPGPLEDYAETFDDLFATLAQRRGLREYLTGLLLPRDRNKALTALAGMEPIVGAQGAPAQRLQFFLSESAWEAEAVNARRLRILREDPKRSPHEQGVLVIDETLKTVRTARRPTMSATSTWARWAGSLMGSSQSRAYGLMRRSTIHWMWSPTLRPSVLRKVGAIPLSAPSPRSRWSS
jgi:hypothetical protein